MNRVEVIKRLKGHADAVKAMGATSLYMFGSIARDSATAASDLDLFIDYDEKGRFNVFHLVSIKLFLEEALDVPVDVTTRDGPLCIRC